MKTFIETVRKEEKPEVSIGIPTFSEAIKQKDNGVEIDEAFTGKDDVSRSFEALHALQLELQQIEKEMLTMRNDTSRSIEKTFCPPSLFITCCINKTFSWVYHVSKS